MVIARLLAVIQIDNVCQHDKTSIDSWKKVYHYLGELEKGNEVLFREK